MGHFSLSSQDHESHAPRGLSRQQLIDCGCKGSRAELHHSERVSTCAKKRKHAQATAVRVKRTPSPGNSRPGRTEKRGIRF
jgi:hypothetical protein